MTMSIMQARELGRVIIDTEHVIKRAAIDAASSGNNTLVAAIAGKKIKVLGVTLYAAGAVNIKFQSGAGGDDLTGLIYFAAAGDYTISMTLPGFHWIETAAGALLNLSLSDAVQVSGAIVYYEE